MCSSCTTRLYKFKKRMNIVYANCYKCIVISRELIPKVTFYIFLYHKQNMKSKLYIIHEAANFDSGEYSIFIHLKTFMVMFILSWLKITFLKNSFFILFQNCYPYSEAQWVGAIETNLLVMSSNLAGIDFCCTTITFSI